MEPLTDADPREVGRYRLLGRLGSGGMGVVYLGRSPGRRLVAVKCVHRDLAGDAEFRQRFSHELAAVRRVGGFHTAQVVDADPQGDPPWLVTAYIPGPSLAEAVAAHGPLPESALHVVGAGLAEALDAIHAAGLIHRDLKPSNVLLADDGPRVIDFGIARALDGATLTRTQVVVGTPGYMAPEQISGGLIGPPCDVFALGLVLCHAAGVQPYGAGDPRALPYRIVHTDPDLGGVPESVRPFVGACLARDPAERPTPAELLRRFESGPESADASWLPPALRAMVTERAPAAVLPGPLAAPDDTPAVSHDTPADVPQAPTRTAVRTTPDLPPAPGVAPAPALPAQPAAAPEPPAVPPTPTYVTTPAASSAPGVPGGPVESAESAAAAESAETSVLLGSPPGRERRGRRALVIVLAVVVLGALGTAIPLYLGHRHDAAGAPDCFASDKGGKDAVTPPSVTTPPPAGTPHPPTLTTPVDQEVFAAGRPIALHWNPSGKHSDISIKSAAGTWRYSGWTTRSTCVFTPTEPGVYFWEVSGATAASGAVGSANTEQRSFFVKPADGGSVTDTLQGAPHPARLISPADQDVFPTGKPVTLSWSTTASSSLVEMNFADRGWQQYPWQSGTTLTITPSTPGLYTWSVATSNGSGHSSEVSEQRYLIVRSP